VTNACFRALLGAKSFTNNGFLVIGDTSFVSSHFTIA
jgi:hypothetical protein